MLKRFFIYFAVLVWLATPLSGCGKTGADKKPAEKPATSAQTGAMVTCPVCGLQFRESESVGTESYRGKTCYFYLEDHRQAFKADPEAYIPSEDRTDE